MKRYLWGVQNLNENLNETLSILSLTEIFETRPLSII